MISVVLFSVAVSAAPSVPYGKVAAPPSYIPGVEHHNLPLPAVRAAYIPHQYQAPSFQAYYQPQILVKTAAPVLTATEVRAAPKPQIKEYRLRDGLPVPQPQWAILRSNLDNNFDGSFQFDYQTENGISMVNSGYLKQVAPEKMGQVMEGQYSYTAPDGQVITTFYTADENGFVARGDHLPQAPLEPELPPLIAKSLAYIRSLPPRPEFQE